MARSTNFLKLNIYDIIEDANLPNKDVVTGVFGYNNSNMVKIDTAVKNLNDNMHNLTAITSTQIDALF